MYVANYDNLDKKGFTVVELLVVIVIIGILAAISTVSYTGISQKALSVTLVSDLDNASRQLKLDQIINSNYPASLALANNGLGIKASPGTTYQYSVDNNANPQTFCITATKSSIDYKITNDSAPVLGDCKGYGLIAYYPFDTDANDTSGNGRNGVVNGATFATGKKGMSYQFSNSSTYVDLPNNIGYSSNLSVFAWFISLGTPGNNFHIVFGGSEFEISIPTDGAIRTGVFTNSRFVSNHGSGLLDGNWHHVGFTFDGTTKTSYIDGVNVGVQSVSGVLTNSFANRRIGVFGSTTSYFANGKVDDVFIYNRVLSTDEVGILYNSY